MEDVWSDTAFISESIMANIFEEDFGIQKLEARDMAAQVIDLFLCNPEYIEELKEAIGE